MISVLSLGLCQAEQRLSPDLSFVIQNYRPNFRPTVNILLVYFGGVVVVVVVVVLVLVVVTGVKQSQLLDLSLGLGLEFDNNLSEQLRLTY